MMRAGLLLNGTCLPDVDVNTTPVIRCGIFNWRRNVRFARSLSESLFKSISTLSSLAAICGDAAFFNL